MVPQRLARVLMLVLLVIASMTLAGCEAIGDIFKAGVWVGVLFVVIVIAIVGFIAAKARG
jgi:uncharacterized membrane protein YkvI